MAKSKTIRATPNVLKCAVVIREALNRLKSGEDKTRAMLALDYLDRTFSGEPQPNKGIFCPVNKAIVKQPL